jgi:hypothetical protein
MERFADLGRGSRIIYLNGFHRNAIRRCEWADAVSRWGPISNFSEYSNEPLGSIKGGKLERMSGHQLLKQGSAAWK